MEITTEDYVEATERFDDNQDVVNFLSQPKETRDIIKETSPLVHNSESIETLYSLPLYKPFAVKNQKALFDMDKAYEPKREQNVFQDFVGYIQKQALSENLNKTILAERKAEGYEKEYLRDKLFDMQKQLSYLPAGEGLGQNVLETTASIVRSSYKNAPFMAMGAALTLAGMPYAVPLAGALRGYGAFATTYEDTKNSLKVQLLEQYPDITDDELEEYSSRGAALSSTLESVGEFIGAGNVAYKSLTDNAFTMLKKYIDKNAKQKALKTSEKLLKFGKDAALGAVGEAALQEVPQNNIERLTLEKKKTAEIIVGTVKNMAKLTADFASGKRLDENEQEDIKTFMSTLLGSLLFEGAIGGINKTISSAQNVMDYREEAQVREADKRYFDNSKAINLPSEVQEAVVNTQASENKFPERRYAEAQKVVDTLNITLDDSNLTQQQRDTLTSLRDKAQEAVDTTGVFEISGEDFTKVFLNKDYGEKLFQRVNNDEMFFVKPSMVKGNFSYSQLQLQAVQDIMPDAIQSDSAFMESYNFLKENNKGDESSIVAMAAGQQALANAITQATGKSYADIKKENNISFTASEENALAEGEQSVAGSLYNDANQIVLNLTNDSNPTTFSHETFHLFDVLMGRYLEQDQLSNYWAKQYEKMYKAIGVDITKGFITTKGVLEQKAYAGSSSDYNTPSLEAIGTGEEQQVHGWGLYYALNKEIAETYRIKLTQKERRKSFDKLEDVLEKLKSYARETNKEEILNILKDSQTDNLKEKISLLEDFERRQSLEDKHDKRLSEFISDLEIEFGYYNQNKLLKGQVVEVNIPENEYLLDEQKNLEEQDSNIVKKIELMNKESKAKGFLNSLRNFKKDSEITGMRIYNKISNYLGSDELASKELEKYGIKGITYFGAKDKRCFVVFNDKDISLLNKFYQGGKRSSNSLVKAREELAESWTKYLGEGVAPKEELLPIFSKFKEMFTEFYDTMLKGNSVKKPIREVFDKIFLSQKEAELAAKAIRVGAMQRPDDIPDEVWEKYVNSKQRMVSRASNKIIKAVTEIGKFKKTEEYAAKQNEITNKVRAELEQKLVYQVQKFVADNKLGNDQLALAVVNNQFGLNMEIGEYSGYLKHDKIDVELNERVESELTSWMKERLADLYAMTQAYNNVQNLDAIDAIIYEYIFSSGRDYRAFGEVKAEMRKNVMNMLKTTSINELAKADKYRKMMNANVMRQQGIDEKSSKMAELKKNQAALMMMIQIAEKAEKKLADIRKLANKFKTEPTKQDVKNVDARSYDLLKSIFREAGFKVGKPREIMPTIEKFQRWMHEHSLNSMFPTKKDLLGFGFDVINNAHNGYLNLSYNDFNSLAELVNAINSVAKFDTVRQIGENKYNFRSDALEVADHLYKMGYNPKETALKKFAFWGMSPIRFFSKFFPESFNFKYVKPLKDGFIKAQVWESQRSEEFANILGKEKDRLQDVVTIDMGNGVSFGITREKQLMFLLNSVNEHNANCAINTIETNPREYGIEVIVGEGEDALKRAEAEAHEKAINTYRRILESSSEELQDIANQILENIERFSGDVSQAHLEADGLLMKRVQPSHFEFEGSKLNKKFGYFPATVKTSLRIAGEYDQNYIETMGYPTEQYVRDRTNGVHTLDLSLEVLSTWVRATGDYINIAPAWNSFSKVTSEKDFIAAVGDQAGYFIKSYMDSLMRPEKTHEMLRVLDSFANVKILGASPIKAIRQLSGLLFSASDIGVGNMAYGISKTAQALMTHPNWLKYASSLSDYMNTRYSDPSKYLYGGYDNLKIEKSRISKLYGSYAKALLMPLTYMDLAASVATWEAAHLQAIKQGKTEEQSVFLADNAVAMTQGDSSALSRPAALKGNLRFITKYSTYFFSLQSSIATDLMLKNDPARISHIASTIFCAMILGSIYETLITDIGKKLTGDDDDDEEIWKKSLKNFVSTASNTAIPEFNIGGAIGRALTEQKVYRSQLTSLAQIDNFAQIVNDMTTGRQGMNDVFYKLYTLPMPSDMVKLFKQFYGE